MTDDDGRISPVDQLEAEISPFLSLQNHIWSSSRDSKQFLRSIDMLLRTIPNLSPSYLDHAEDLLQRSMSRLRSEFNYLLCDTLSSPAALDDEPEDPDLPIPVAQPVQDFNVVIDALPGGNIRDLGDIAKRMAAAGFGQECANAYSISRKDFVEESVSRLGVRVFSTSQVQNMECSDLDLEIERWNQAIKVVFHILFPSERRLSDRVFAGLAPIADLGFADACRETAVNFLRFAAAVATGQRVPEKLFKVVRMYETLKELLPQIHVVFEDQYCEYLVEEYDLCWMNLGQAVKDIFVELENLVKRDLPNRPLPGGGVHPITRYVINYLHAASFFWRILQEIMEDSAVPATSVDELRPSSSLSAQIGWIMERLNQNLEEKSRAYDNEALSFVFLMNNGQYIVDKLGSSELKMMLGNEWIRGQHSKIRQWLGMYHKRCWAKMIALIQISSEGLGSVLAVKSKLKYFNTYLQDIRTEQKGWVILNDQLRDKIRSSTVDYVIPTYSSFLERARRELGRRMDNTVKHSPDDVEACIRELFVVVTRQKPPR